MTRLEQGNYGKRGQISKIYDDEGTFMKGSFKVKPKKKITAQDILDEIL